MMIQIQQILLLIVLCIYITIVILGTRKSNTAVAGRKRPVDKWAIIDREYVEFTAEEIEWRSHNGR